MIYKQIKPPVLNRSLQKLQVKAEFKDPPLLDKILQRSLVNPKFKDGNWAGHS